MTRLAIADSKRLGGLGVLQRRRLRDWLAQREHRAPERPPSRLVVLAGPTAVGKGAVSTYIREHHRGVLLSVSATTRAPRPGEVDGANYYFVDDAEFDRMIAQGEMLEWQRCTTPTGTAPGAQAVPLMGRHHPVDLLVEYSPDRMARPRGANDRARPGASRRSGRARMLAVTRSKGHVAEPPRRHSRPRPRPPAGRPRR